MVRIAANLSMLFTERPFLERFDAAAGAGFQGVEFLFPYAFETSEIAARLEDNALTQALFNMPPGDWAAGERGLAALPGRESEFRDTVAAARDYAKALDCPRVHCMAGIVEPARHEAAERTYIDNLRYAAGALADDGITLLIEPINTRDMPGYFLSDAEQAGEILRAVDAPNVKLQFDFYHAQIMGGDVWTRFVRHRALVGHIQIAGVPARHEPDEGELNGRWLLEQLAANGYDGWIGAEYHPRGGTEAGLGWFQPYRR